MKSVWVELDKWNRDVVTSSIEGGVDAIICPADMVSRVKELGKIKVISEGGDLIPEKDVFFISSKELFHISNVEKYAGKGIICIDFCDWDIVGLENIVALGCEVFVKVDNDKRLDVALEVLEKGVSGVVLPVGDYPEIKNLKKVISKVKDRKNRLLLETARVKSVKQVGMGDRVCVDFAMMLNDGEGLLVGNVSSFFFLIHAETLDNPYVDPRPFRVNAGGVHAYVFMPGNKTKYLCELKSGDRALIVSYDGLTREAIVGRVKIERRPMILINAEANGVEGSIILQNAETIRLVDPNGKALSVARLKEGDEIIVKQVAEGRHFGMSVEETIWES